MWNSDVEVELRDWCVQTSGRHDVAHDLLHTDFVVSNVKRLLAEVPCRAEVVIAAAYLHDLAPKREGHDYAKAPEESGILARAPLKELGFRDETVAAVQACIATASWEHAALGGVPSSTEAYLLRDADLLEAIGAHGIARVFSFAGANGASLGWLSVDLANPPRLDPNIRSLDPSVFHHVYAKLLWLNELMYSEAAKQEARVRRAFLMDFLRHYERENRWASASKQTRT